VRFNLIEAPWIPVRLKDGRLMEWGLAMTLDRAREIAALEDPSPLVVAALHRFLLAVLYRALQGPCDRNQARALFKDGWPPQAITAYLDRWRDRFWLFHPTHPFGQIPSFEPVSWKPWTVLAAEHNADNAKVLFDHLDIQDPGSLPEAKAARLLLATLTFSVSCGKSELAHTGTAPSATAAMVLPQGRDLADTLLFALVPQLPEILTRDRPIWERDPEIVASLKTGITRVPDGLADRYTWRTRSIRFAESPDGVARLAFASGVGCTENEQIDPMLGYRFDEKLKKRLPVILKERGVWRDFDSLLPDGGIHAPASLEHAVELARRDRSRFPKSLWVLGQSNNKAKIEYWRMERFVLPGALAEDRELRSFIHALLEKAEKANHALWSTCSLYARNLLARGGRAPDPKDIRAFTESMTPLPLFWAEMEAQFHRILGELTDSDQCERLQASWLEALARALVGAWEHHRTTVSGGDAWALRALAKAEGPLRKHHKELQAMIHEFNPVEVP